MEALNNLQFRALRKEEQRAITIVPSSHDLINKIETSDIILVEGYKKENHKKIEVIRKIDPFHKPLFSHVKNIIAVVSNEKIDTDLPVFKDNDFNTIGEFILSQKI